MGMPRQWFFRVSPTRLYGVEWWGFARYWMVFTMHRFGYGWLVTIGPIRIYRPLICQPAAASIPEQEK